MTIALPYRRQQPQGKNIAKAPNRGDVTGIRPASDPGVGGGPPNVPLGAFGGGDGLVTAGNAITNYGIEELDELAKIKAKTETIQLENAVTSFKSELEGIGNKPNGVSFDPENGHKLMEYYNATAAAKAKALKTVEGQNYSGEFKMLFGLKIDNAMAVSNAAMTKSVGTAQDKILGTRLDDDLSKASNDPELLKDLSLLVDTHNQIGEKFRDLLDYEVIQEKIRLADKTAIIYRSKQYFREGNFKRAREVFRDDILAADGAMPQKDKLEWFSTIEDAEREAALKTEKDKLEKPGAKEKAIMEQESAHKIALIEPFFRKKGEKEGEGTVPLKLIKQIAGLKEEKLTEFESKMAVINNMDWATDADKKKYTLTALGQATIDAEVAVIKELKLPPEEEKQAILKLTKAHTESPEDAGIFDSRKKQAEKVQDMKPRPFVPRVPDIGTDANISNEVDALLKEAHDGGESLPQGHTLDILELKRLTSDFYYNGNPIDIDPNKRDLSLNEAFSQAYNKMIKDGKFDLPMRQSNLEQFKEIVAPINIIPEKAPEPYKGKEKGDYKEDFAKMKKANLESEKTLTEDPLLLEKLEAEALAQNVSIDQATSIPSAISSILGGTIGQVPGLEYFANAKVTQSRLLYSMIARDFVRFVSLSPRYAVKEQDLIRGMYPGPEAFNSPRQAMQRLQFFKGMLLESLNGLQQELKQGVSPDDWKEMKKVAGLWTGMIKKINRFTPKFQKIPTSMKEIKAMNKAQATDFWTSMSRPDKIDYVKNHGMAAADAVKIRMDSEGNVSTEIPKGLTKKKPKQKTRTKTKKTKTILKQLDELKVDLPSTGEESHIAGNK
tara:strand:- start:508 stop:3015 length:2508 start_codon:yes stop_codon:yes gene_type:complete